MATTIALPVPGGRYILNYYCNYYCTTCTKLTLRIECVSWQTDGTSVVCTLSATPVMDDDSLRITHVKVKLEPADVLAMKDAITAQVKPFLWIRVCSFLL